MSVAKVIEVISKSKISFEDAIKQGVSRASETVNEVTGAWVKDQSVEVSNGKIQRFAEDHVRAQSVVQGQVQVRLHAHPRMKNPVQGDRTLNALKLVAILLIVGGVLGLTYGGFSYTKDTTAVKLGPLELSVQEKETVNVPLWVGIAAIAAGGLLLVIGGKSR